MCGCVGGGGGKRSTDHVKRMWRGAENLRGGGERGVCVWMCEGCRTVKGSYVK